MDHGIEMAGVTLKCAGGQKVHDAHVFQSDCEVLDINPFMWAQ
jgi:hypothetical protein